MRTLILDHDQVVELLPMAECIRLMREAFTTLGQGRAFQPLRAAMRPTGLGGVLGLMPAYLPDPRPAFGMKTICVFPGNVARGMDSHQGAVLLFEPDTGRLLAVMNAEAITAIRTAAASGLATDLLARPDASRLALVGAGFQARTHLEAMARVRPIEYCAVVSRNFANAQRFAAEYSGKFGFPVEAMEQTRDAVAGADVIVTVTNAKTPVIERSWIAAGTHINAAGSCLPTTREIDGPTMAAATLFTDRRESMLNEAGDFLLAQADGLVAATDIQAELGELLTGGHPGRRLDSEITLFESLGIGIEDVAAAGFLYNQAVARGVGQWVNF